MESVVNMKKFFRNDCLVNASGIAAFVLISLYLLLVWMVMRSGFFLLQLLAVLSLLYFLFSGFVGFVIAIVALIRKLVEVGKRKVTERDLDK